MNKLVRATVLVSIALLLMSSTAGAVSAAPTTITENGAVYQGHDVQTESLFNASETVGLYSVNDGHVRDLTAASDGTVTFDTDSLRGGHYLAQSGSKALNFSVRPVDMDASFDGIEVSNGGNTEVAKVTFELNTGNRDLVITSGDIVNLADRTDGAEMQDGQLVGHAGGGGDVHLKIDVSNLDDGSYRIEAKTADEIVGKAGTWIELDSQTKATPATTPNTERLVHGESYWVSSKLVFEHNPDAQFVIENEGQHVFSGSTDSNGQYLFETAGKDAGQYTISNSSSGEELLAFELREQTMNATVVNSSVDVSSNRAGYDLTVFVEELNRSQLLDIIPAAEVTNSGNVLVRKVSANTSLDVDTSNLSDGNYTVHVAANDTDAKATAVIELQSGSSTSSSTSGSLEATTATTTATATATPTQTATATATRTQTATGTPNDAGGVSPSDAAGAGATAVGLGGAALLARKYAG